MNTNFEELGYSNVRCFPNSIGYCGLNRFIFTTGLVVGLDEFGYVGRYCYHTWKEASDALRDWDGNGDPPGEWIKYKGKGGERSRIKKVRYLFGN